MNNCNVCGLEKLFVLSYQEGVNQQGIKFYVKTVPCCTECFSEFEQNIEVLMMPSTIINSMIPSDDSYSSMRMV